MPADGPDLDSDVLELRRGDDLAEQSCLVFRASWGKLAFFKDEEMHSERLLLHP